MTNQPPMVRISQIAFATDLTKSGGLIIPLGTMLEGVWPSQARWLGLTGRMLLSEGEIGLVNCRTWPELERPFDRLLMPLFQKAWKAGWGEAGACIERDWDRSSLLIHTEDAVAVAGATTVVIRSREVWHSTKTYLEAHLALLSDRLKPDLGTVKRSVPPSFPDVLDRSMGLGHLALEDISLAA